MSRCPHCNKTIAIKYLAKLVPVSDLTYTIKVQPGQFLLVETFCSTLQALVKALVATARHIGGHAVVYLVGLDYGESEMSATVRVVQTERGKPMAEPDATPD